MRVPNHLLYSSPKERILSNVVISEDGCWLWKCKLSYDGYGQITVHSGGRRSSRGIHRYAYEVFKGPIPPALQVDHLCKNRACCNPEHLEAVTPRINVLRSSGLAAANAAKTHCKRGHIFDDSNTLRTPNGRTCRACKSISCKARLPLRREIYAAKKALRAERAS